MAIDFCFDCVGAGHRRSLADERSRRTERKASRAPEWLQRSRPNPSLGHELVESIEMAPFLSRHSRNLMRSRGASTEDCQLAGIDAGGPIFASLIHAKH